MKCRFSLGLWSIQWWGSRTEWTKKNRSRWWQPKTEWERLNDPAPQPWIVHYEYTGKPGDGRRVTNWILHLGQLWIIRDRIN